MKNLFLFFCTIISIVSCEKKTEAPLIIPPDYLHITAEPLNPFRETKIKMITSYVPKYPHDTDTIYLNSLGKISTETGSKGWAQYAYDTLGNVIHTLKTKGGARNYFFSYKREKNILIRKSYLIPHMWWEFDKHKDKLQEIDSTFFIFNNDGRLEQRIRFYSPPPHWKKGKSIIDYKYSFNKKLSSVENYYVNENSDTTIGSKSVFNYNQDDTTLYKIEYFVYPGDSSTILTEHFYNGDDLLDSTRRFGIVRIYNYEYY